MLFGKWLKYSCLLVIGGVFITAMSVVPVERPIIITKWDMAKDQGCEINLQNQEENEEMLTAVRYRLKSGFGWVELKTDRVRLDTMEQPISFKIRANASADLEIKFIDKDGSVFGRKIKLNNNYEDWEEVTISKRNMDYWWGGDDKLNGVAYFAFAISGTGQGEVQFKEFKTEKMDKPLTFSIAGPQIDPDSKKGGYGFEARRARKLEPENELVLEYLKVIQDTSSSDQQLLSSHEGHQAQTFNNALVAMAFTLKGEKERAERILDFYANATIKNNSSPTLQNFYYQGEARGFFQHVVISGEGKTRAYHHKGDADRWMGDMAWLWFAYHYYGKTFNDEKYEEISNELLALMKEWYKDDPKGGGYVQHGWRKGDSKLHEASGHHEGNIDAYSVFELSGDKKLSRNIKKWLERELHDRMNLPLDLYTWRSLAYEKRPELLDIVDFDFRYRKVVEVDDETRAMGFFSSANGEISNIWLDGLGHMACAYYAVGNHARGNFYANQMDSFLIERDIANTDVMAMPYTFNKEGGYSWVNLDKGFISTCAWYIFAKNKFNPMTLKKY